MTKRLFIGLLCSYLVFTRGFTPPSTTSAEPTSTDLFAKKNLVAWCIVPFDSKKRRPEERAAMLEKLGFSKFAYDYRSEHIPTFDAEIEALKRHQIELSAWWFPTSLNDEAKLTLAVFARHKVTPQLWVTGGGEPTKSEQEQQQRVRDEAARIRPIAEAAAKIGCKVALYNHGGWFGEPENQIAIIQELKLPNVGIVYNQHHGHEHLDRFPVLLQKMKPFLYTLNLNGMVKGGDRQGQKILQLGEGDLDLALLKVIKNSGYTGPIGILGHTPDDAEERLHDNLDGLDWLLPQLAGKPAGPKPKMRTPVPVAQNNPEAALPNANVPRLVEGKFGKAIDGRAGGAFVAGRDEFRQFPITVECWTKLADKAPYNILVAHELKSSGTHWELFSMSGTGNFTVYTPGFAPDHCHSNAMICDGKWHHVAMVLETERIRLFVDGQIVANQVHRRTEMKSVRGDLAIASLVDQQFGCTGLLDEVRISRGIRSFASFSEKAFSVDETTLSLWHLDELFEQKQFDDATRNSPAVVGIPSTAAANVASRTKIEGHWGEDALGFRWTEDDSRDDRFGQMDTGPVFSGSITGLGGTIYKGIVVRVGANRTASICYDTELMRASAGWTGFLKFDPARFGIIVPPRIDGDVTFTTPLLGGWSRTEQFSNFRETSRYGGLPKTEAHYEGLYRHGKRVVLKFTVGTHQSPDAADKSNSTDPVQGLRTVVLESPWLEEAHGVSALSRTLLIGPSTTPLSVLVGEESSRVRLIAPKGTASLTSGQAQSRVLVVPARTEPITVKLLVAAPSVSEASLDQLVATSPVAEDLVALTKPGPTIWGEPLVTTGEVSNIRAPFVIDTITLPFENPFRALMFCGGHDFLPDGRAFVCTLHGDVWLVDGIDETLKRITWRRFATGLFQPLGVKLMPAAKADKSSPGAMNLYVVGRDQITRLHDFNNDGEADFYENFNNDAYVSLNGHEYVTSLETDRAGNFYYVKGNCDSAIPHDGSLLRVSPNGSKLDIFATGFRNSNGIGIGPNDEITVAPQEGEWTPASAVFAVHQGGFYGAMMSHHQSPPPTDFERPFCWFPRLADNSCGGQVWVPPGVWGPLANQLLHLSYGQCELRLLLRESLANGEGVKASDGISSQPEDLELRRSPLVTMNGGSTEFPMTFASGIHRGRFNQKDGHLYLTGLKGWVTSAVNDGCFQRVRYTGLPMDMLVGMRTYRNGIALTFTRPLNRNEAIEIDNYQLEAWNYHWSAAYGSPDLRPSAPGQVGRDPVEPKSVTLLNDNRTIFIELPELKPVDQLGISYSLHAADGTAIENTAYLTLNGIPNDLMPEDKLHRSAVDLERSQLIARMSPGVILTATSLAGPMHRRMMAWADLGSIGSGKSRQEVVVTGYLKVPFTGEYRFNATSETPAHLEIDGRRHVLGDGDAVIRLRKGLTKIRVQSEIQEKSRFRLMWETDRFPREAIPATALFHDEEDHGQADDRQDIGAGRSLFARYKCAQCHKDESNQSAIELSSTLFEYQRHAPLLHGIGSRFQPDWLAAWLRNPTHVRSDAVMPAIPELQNDAALDDLVAYLVSLRDVIGTPQDSAVQSTRSSDVGDKKGEVLFERLGCIACHTFTAADEHPEWDRVSLQFVKVKFQPGQLERFLLMPHRHHVGSHMPDFHLNEDEALALAAYIELNSKGILPSFENGKSGNLERGKQLFVELRCDRCHQTTPADTKGVPNVRSAIMVDATQGCLGDSVTPLNKAPAFKWTDRQRESLRVFLTAVSRGKAVDDESNQRSLPRLLSVLRCTACHSRDSTSAKWPEIVADEGSGKLSEAVPQLTWVGEKLQGPWISKLIRGDLRQKPRPWLTARMPSFPAYGNLIAHAMADEHGVSFDEPLPRELDGRSIEVGHRLTLRDGGLDCRQCHGVGKDLPRGDAATQIALGINFSMTRDRLRPEFALRQLFDPPRYDIGSRMPRFSPDLRSTAAKQIEGGDARKQFEAIEQYLWSIRVDD